MATVRVDSKRLSELERKAAELEDYYQATRLMRAMAVDMTEKAKEGSLFAEGWLAANRDWAAFILRAMNAREAA